MTQIKIPAFAVVLLLMGFLSTPAVAENAKTFGDYVVHFNAFRSDTLTPEIAKAYSLTRRNNRMVVNINVQKKEGNTSKSVKASVTGFASNLTGQVKQLEFKEVHDGDAIYYLAESKVSNRETLRFEIKATPEGAPIVAQINFKQQFFTD